MNEIVRLMEDKTQKEFIKPFMFHKWHYFQQTSEKRSNPIQCIAVLYECAATSSFLLDFNCSPCLTGASALFVMECPSWYVRYNGPLGRNSGLLPNVRGICWLKVRLWLTRYPVVNRTTVTVKLFLPGLSFSSLYPGVAFVVWKPH